MNRTFISSLLLGFVAVQHLAFLVLEMFLWTNPIGQAVFGTTPEFAAQTAVLAANQGLYNGFLAAGLCWGLIAANRERRSIRLFFSACVVVAGVFGAATADVTILYVQALPAALALASVLWAEADSNLASQ